MTRATFTRAFNPDQERDENGRWAIMYHGTTDRNLESIRTEGLKPGPKGHVDLTSVPDAARGFARTVSGLLGGKPVLLRVRVPRAELRPAKDSWTPGHSTYRGTVRPRDIKIGKVFDPDQPRDEQGQWSAGGGSWAEGGDARVTEADRTFPRAGTVVDGRKIGRAHV